LRSRKLADKELAIAHTQAVHHPAVGDSNHPECEEAELISDAACTALLDHAEQLFSFKRATWRSRFLPLSEILCWPATVTRSTAAPDPNSTQFIIGSAQVELPGLMGGFHPDLVADRLRQSLARMRPEAGTEALLETIQPKDGIPPQIRRAIERQVTKDDQRAETATRHPLDPHAKRGSAVCARARGRPPPPWLKPGILERLDPK
jgi:hypothetical protein